MSSRCNLKKVKGDINFNNLKNDEMTEYEEFISSKNDNITSNKKEVSFIDDIMHILFLGVGASSLSIVKVPYYISLILTIIFIALIGIINIYFSYYTLIDIIDENKNNPAITDETKNKKDIIDNTKKKGKRRSIKNKKQVKEKEKEKEEDKKEEKKEEKEKEKEKEEEIKRRIDFFNDICKDLNIFNIPFIFGEIIIHQILIYRSLGGIVNIIGEFNYDSLFIFLSDTYWRELSMKFMVNIIFCLLLLFPLYLKIDAETIESLPIIGFNIILFIVLGVFIQFFYYFIYYCITEFNYRDISKYPNKRECPSKIFQSLSIFFYCYSGHNGFFNIIPMDKKLKKPEIRRKEFMYASISSMVIYFIFSCLGFLSVPKDVVDNVIEKKRFWNKDIVMTFSRILLLPFCVFKIIINLDKLRYIFFCNILKNIPFFTKLRKFLFCKKKEIDEELKVIFTFFILSITCICASLYQNIVGYITIIGGFFVPIPTFLIPQIKLKKYIEKEFKCNFSNWRRIIFGIILCFFGIVGSIFGIIDIFKGEL